MGKGHEFGWSGRTDGGVGRIGARSGAGWSWEVLEVEVPKAGRRGAMAKEDDGVGVADGDGGCREVDITASIA